MCAFWHTFGAALVTIRWAAVNQKREPEPSVLSKPIRPPCASTISCARAKPRPGPADPRRRPALDAEELLEDVLLLGGRDAEPVVGHRHRARRPAEQEAETATSPPSGEYLIALESRFATTWAMRAAIADRGHRRLARRRAAAGARRSGPRTSAPAPRSSSVDRERLARQRQAVLLDRLDVEEVVDQRRQPLRLAVDGPEDLVARRRRPAAASAAARRSPAPTPAASAARARRSPSGRT